jgi:hypothetical protein
MRYNHGLFFVNDFNGCKARKTIASSDEELSSARSVSLELCLEKQMLDQTIERKDFPFEPL